MTIALPRKRAAPSGYQYTVLELAQRLRLQREELTGYRDHINQLPTAFDSLLEAHRLARETLIAALEAEYRKSWKG